MGFWRGHVLPTAPANQCLHPRLVCPGVNPSHSLTEALEAPAAEDHAFQGKGLLKPHKKQKEMSFMLPFKII